MKNRWTILHEFWYCPNHDFPSKSQAWPEMHGSVKAWGDYPRCLERIEQRISDLDILPKASSKGIRRHKSCSTCLGPRGIFNFTMHGCLKAWGDYPRWLERTEQRISDLDIPLKASPKGIRRHKSCSTCLGPRGIFKSTLHGRLKAWGDYPKNQLHILAFFGKYKAIHVFCMDTYM